MLTLLPGSCCDVCANEYGPHCLPHSIPCGHVLCASCCNTIVEKTSPRLSPACPFCREQFTTDNVRVIRTDFSSSGWNTPRRLPVTLPTSDPMTDFWNKKEERILLGEGGGSRVRDEARRLEDKVARIAAKKCSVEEVSALHQELEAWLRSPAKNGDQPSSLHLSVALLRAILMNHVVHTEASKTAKNLEAALKGKIDDLEIKNGKLDTELRHLVSTFPLSTRTELNRLKVVATTLGSPPPSSLASSITDARPRAMSPPPPSTTPAPNYAPSTPSRFNPHHTRSASMHNASSRPSTPASASMTSIPSSNHLPTTNNMTTTNTTPLRSHTPSVLRSQTPAIPPLRHAVTPSPMMMSTMPTTMPPNRAQTPGPLIPPKPRRFSTTTPTPLPTKMTRSVSDEKREVHERWLPEDYTKSQHHQHHQQLPQQLPQRSASRASDAFKARHDY
ncbi:hypothetical protein K435DRAFT_967069 [Dendrothele bispora CBS 962.96]|uniref:RING-type domain-containing protein n=1 Tax=Dendrothele bispora (strain CBS 962.96) TaxID=1314807 RepID=A0A4S8LWC7_DENBC|nr:hypothetical protein K435DRAFT_967069 [Dendrothele bispora CBS 962.96]